MSPHWRLALVYAVSAMVLATLVGLLLFFIYGGAHFVSLLYGSLVGVLSFVSTAFTVSLLTGRSSPVGMMIGGGSFMVRMGFAVIALGIPAYLDLWPEVVMLAGFASVYLAENVLLVPVLLGKRHAGFRGAQPASEGIERRTEV